MVFSFQHELYELILQILFFTGTIKVATSFYRYVLYIAVKTEIVYKVKLMYISFKFLTKFPFLGMCMSAV